MKDKKLIEKYIEDNDQQAFSKLFERHKDKMKGYIMKYVKDSSTADDILQQTYYKILDKVEDVYEERGKFSSWAFRIAHNNCIDYLRKQKKFTDVESNLLGDEVSYFDIMTSTAIQPDDLVEIEDYDNALWKCIEKLPEEQRTVLILRAIYEMRFKDIAKHTKVSINTALGRMRYARMNLEKYLEKYHDSKSYKLDKEDDNRD